MRIGDRIRFINDIGGGTVKKFPTDIRFVIITDDNGFVIPVLKSDCVVVKPGIDYGNLRGISKQKEIKRSDNLSGKIGLKGRQVTGGKNVIEVDLHIEKLRPSEVIADLKSVLEYQLVMAKHILESNKQKSGTRIIFIHGRGEGKLRRSLIKLIEENYPGTVWQDGSFAKYGVGGALQIEI